MKNLINSDFISPKQLEEYFVHADLMRNPFERIDPLYLLRGKIIGIACQDRIKYEVAISRLGGKAIILSDNLEKNSYYLDCIVTDNDLNFTPKIPVIDDRICKLLAGIYLIKRNVGKLHGLNSAIIGDFNNCEFTSNLIKILSLYKQVRFHLYPENNLPKEVLKLKSIFVTESSLDKFVHKVDLVYVSSKYLNVSNPNISNLADEKAYFLEGNLQNSSRDDMLLDLYLCMGILYHILRDK